MLRICSKCKEEKNIEEFVKDKRNVHGRGYECLACKRLRAKEYQKRMPEEVRQKKRIARSIYGQRHKQELNAKHRERHAKNPEVARAAGRRFREANPEKRVQWNKEWREKNWEKVLAHSKLKDHVDRGNIIRPEKCTICNASDSPIEAHHSDYSKPLEVLWICKKCHAAIHRRLKEHQSHRERLSDETSKEDAKV